MTMPVMNIVFLLVFLCALFAIGIYFGRNNRSVSDYLLGGKSLPIGVSALTIAATMYGGGMLVGRTSYAYDTGVMMFLYGLSPLLTLGMAMLMCSKMKNFTSYTTVTEFLDERYHSRFLRVTCSILSIISLVGVAGSNVTALVSSITAMGFDNPIPWAVFFMAVIIILTTIGGIKAVAYTDAFQLIVIFIGVPTAMIFCLRQNGGFGQVLNELQTVSDTLPQDYLTAVTPLNMITLLWLVLPNLLNRAISQDIFQRMFSMKSRKEANIACGIAAVLVTILSMPPVVIGMIARLRLPEMAEAGDSSSALAQVMLLYLPDWMFGLLFAAIIAAILSTSDSLLTGAASHFANDVVEVLFTKRLETNREKKLLLATRIFTLAAGFFAVLYSLYSPGIINGMVYAITLYTSGAFVPIFFGVMWKGATRRGAIAGLIAGLLAAVAGFMGVEVGSVPGEIFSSLVGAVVLFLVSILDPQKQ